MTPLWIAAQEGQTAAIEALLKGKADPDKANKVRTATGSACAVGGRPDSASQAVGAQGAAGSRGAEEKAVGAGLVCRGDCVCVEDS